MTERGVTAAVGHCFNLGEGLWPLGAPRKIIAQLLTGLDEAAEADVLGPGQAMLRQLLPELGGDDADTLPVQAANVCALFVGVFHRFARRGPLLVVVEDLHWSDTVTQLLVATRRAPAGRCPCRRSARIVLRTEPAPDVLWRVALAELLRAAHPSGSRWRRSTAPRRRR